MESEEEADEGGSEAEAGTLSYRQRLEKPAGGDIVLMQWSPTMDLLAATFADNSVKSYVQPLHAIAMHPCVFCSCAMVIARKVGGRGC